MGTSMGCMHSWIWAERYPAFMDGVVPLACLPTQIAGRNRMLRKMILDDIRNDPAWRGGDYTEQPAGLPAALQILFVMTSSPSVQQRAAPTRDSADAYITAWLAARRGATDANDMLYQFDASRDYDPSPDLERITAPLLAINSADDLINPPELGIMERLMPRVAHGRYVLVPISERTRGHGTHTVAAAWDEWFAPFVAGLQPRYIGDSPMGDLKVGAFYNPHLGEALAGATGIDHLAMADPPRGDDPWWPKIRERYTLLLHDYLGQLSEPLDEHAIQRARSLAELYRSPWVAEHFQCLHTEDGTYNLNYVFPPLYTEEFLDRFAANASALQARLDQPLVMENIPGFFDVAASRIPEPVWLRRFFDRTNLGFLLDLPHIWLEAHYKRADPKAFLAEFPLDRVVELHVAGVDPGPGSRGDRGSPRPRRPTRCSI